MCLGDLDCTPPDDSLCADVEDMPPYPDGYIIYHLYPCKLASIDRIYTRINDVLFIVFGTKLQQYISF